MNKNQKAFIRSLTKTINQAQKSQEAILDAMSTGKGDKAACYDYIQALHTYINDAQRMVMQCNLSYGRQADQIAIEVMSNATLDN